MSRASFYQARAGVVQDNLRRKLIQNQNTLIGLPVEIIALRLNKNREGDIESRVVEESFMANVNFPPMTDIPTRSLKRDQNNVWTITSLVDSYNEDADQRYLIQSNKQFLSGDMICRVFLMNEREIAANVVVLEVNEILSTFGSNSIIMNKYQCSLYTQDIPSKLTDVVIDYAKRRLQVQY